MWSKVFDDAVRIGKIELVVGKGQPLCRVGPDQCSRILGAVKEVNASDRELRRLPDQAQAAAADIYDPGLGANRRKLQEPFEAAHPGPL